MSKQLKKEIEKAIDEHIKKMGFKKKKFMYYKQIKHNVFVTLYFSFLTKYSDGNIEVDVTVGVLNKTIEELKYKLTGLNNLDLMLPTISTQIGYLMPEKNYKKWNFIENMDNTIVLNDLFNSIQTYGYPYFEQYLDIKQIFDLIEKGGTGVLNHNRDRCLPILYYLKGEKQKGIEFIETAIERQNTPVSDEERAFLQKLAGKDGQVIIGSGVGKVDPEYLKFKENFKLLD
jgi:hypothetical protein